MPDARCKTYASREDEALLRYPGSAGVYDGHRCVCTRECPAVCNGKCGCDACTGAWLDNDLDELIGFR